MSNKLHPVFVVIYGIIILLAVGLGFYLGRTKYLSSETEYTRNTQEFSKSSNQKNGALEMDKIIDLDSARKYNKDFRKFLTHSSSDINNVAALKKMVAHPIDIDNAIGDFEEIFKQDKIVGLRMYPGIRYINGNPQFTLIFIGTKKDGSDLIYPPGTKIGDIITEVETAKVQDQNRPCNPCNKSTFIK